MFQNEEKWFAPIKLGRRISHIFSQRKCSLKPKVSESEVAELIPQMFKAGDVLITKKDVYNVIAPVLIRLKKALPINSLILNGLCESQAVARSRRL